MLDVYRTYYGLSGEPFRLGPDYRFSLQHSSYASAKAYLNYAIYQGEGFIAISGAAGTGKTTLISEILATLDRSRVQVATLTSTQLESRDLLHMVASAFGIQPDRFEKAALVLEIEAYLVKKIRSGQRAMLIVDEAQGLSTGALEELRLLANLQYQYQLLLQICLVGQEKLLDLIHSPGMEHLQQRLVAATTLDPLGFDETIDYIEHRLSKVGWKGDPSIDEAALRLIFRYSGGIPRRINLIANRLFLYGGMEHKHQFNGADAQSVIAGLVDEHLLGSQPLLDDSAIAPREGDTARKPAHLPRTRDSAKTPAAAVAAAAGSPAATAKAPEAAAAAERPAAAPVKAAAVSGTAAEAAVGTATLVADRQATGASSAAPAPQRSRAGGIRLDNKDLPGSRARSAAPARAAEPARARQRPPPNRVRPAPPFEPDDALLRPRNRAPQKKAGSNALVLAAVIVLGAAGIYFIRTNPEAFDLPFGPGDHSGAEQRPRISAPDQAGLERALPALPGADTSAEESTDRSLGTAPPVGDGDTGTILRGPLADGTGAPVGDGQDVPETLDSAAPGEPGGSAAPQAQGALSSQNAAVLEEEPAAAGTPPATADAAPVAGQPEKMPVVPPVAESAAESARMNPPAPTPEPAPAPAHAAPPPAIASTPDSLPASADKSVAPPDAAAIAARRKQLQQAAESRLSTRLARAQADAPAVPASAPARPVPTEAAVAPSRPKTVAARVKKKPLSSAAEVRALLLGGRWNSGTKPASLLPSASTFCSVKSGDLACVSVPQNVKTQYGPALYKVESELSGFSAGGLFEMSYRTLVKLVDKASGRPAAGEWQITEYSMSCKLEDADRVSCLDGKGITREYRRPPR